jgi:16S rRNA (guanine966-N2)-methyltransferase
MRIIGGKYGGRRFQTKAPTGVRPTTDMVRESMFNILTNLIDFKGIKVLDLFAGTGALGIECLSRGAEFCVFVEKNRNTAGFIGEFASSLGIGKFSYDIIISDAAKSLEKTISEKKYNPFDIVFLDPPYNLNINNRIIDLISKNGILTYGGLVVSEQSSLQSIIIPDNYEIIKEKVFGETKIVIIQSKSK